MKRKNKIGIKVVIGILILVIMLCIASIWTNNKEDSNLKSGANMKIEEKNTIEDKVNNNEISNSKTNQETKNSEIFAQYYDEAEEKLEEMTLKEKVSQMFLARCPEKDSLEEVKKEQPGGYILFGRDFESKTKNEVISTIASYQKASKIPMIIGVDEEGGTVVRVSRNKKLVKSKYKSPQELYKEGGLEKIKEDAINKSKTLKTLGINLNLAPVADVSTTPSDFIYQRSFGKDANQTAEYVKILVETMKIEKMASTLKHFPGYGNNKDSHTAVTYDNRSLESFREKDFIPFKVGIKAGAQTVLVCHNIVNKIEEGIPASLSRKVHDILTNELEFTGLILTDDLAMDAATKYANIEEVGILAVEAGNDMLLSSDFIKQRNAIVKAVEEKRITEERINYSVKKIIAYKYFMNVIEQN